MTARKNKIRQAVETATFPARFPVRAIGARRAEEIDAVHDIKNRQQHADARRPHRPAIFRDPPERHALQIAEKQRRVADGRKAAADVGHDENEKDDVMRRDAVLVHPNPRADQQHGRAGGAQNIGDDCADEQKNDVGQRRGLAFDADVDAAGNDEERADERDEAGVIVPRCAARAARPAKRTDNNRA